MSSTGGVTGLLLRGTITGYNGDGTVSFSLEDGKEFNNIKSAPLPISYGDSGGGFVGSIPPRGTPILVSQGQGEWFISAYLPSNNVFKRQGNILGSGGLLGSLMADLKDGNILLQTRPSANGYVNRIVIDPNDGIKVGSATQHSKFYPEANTVLTKFSQNLNFTSAHREITGTIQRDLKQNSLRSITFSTLTDIDYDKSLTKIAMDPSTSVGIKSTSTTIRNLPLVESKTIYYEFDYLNKETNFTTDDDEANRYSSKDEILSVSELQRTEMRTEAFGLSLNYPNHLIENIIGTGVDIYGNVLDLNRNTLPIGKVRDTSFITNSNSKEAFIKIRAMSRKGLAYHWELNARKANFDSVTGIEAASQVPDPFNITDFARSKSKLFLDIDKEGQFKLNVPMSSETGNIALNSRYENSSSIMFAQDIVDEPNLFKRARKNRDVRLANYALSPGIKLSAGYEGLHGYASPIDYITNKVIGFGTAYHDIVNGSLSVFRDMGRKNLINYFGENQTWLNRRNPITGHQPYVKYIESVVSDNIIVSGIGSNAGGRSATISLDGSLVMNVGANTVDRQSIWLDTAGGNVVNLGRDRNGNSLALTADGNLLVQLGNVGLPANSDSRFKDEPAGYQTATLDIRVLRNDGQLAIIRFDGNGAYIYTPGRMEFGSEQDMIFRSNGNVYFEAKSVGFYPDNGQLRKILRSGIAGI